MLRAVPVNCRHIDQKSPPDLCGTTLQGKAFQNFRVFGGLYPTQQFQSGLIRVIHKKQRYAIINLQITCADKLAVAAEIGKSESLLVYHANKSAWPTPMLHIGPPRFADRRHLETVACADKSLFAVSENVIAISARKVVPVLEEFEPPPQPIHIIHQDGRLASAKVRTFVDFIVERLRADPSLNA